MAGEPSLKNANNIFVVDDSRVSRSFIRAALRPLGYDITLAESGEEALELLKKCKPDLILLDLFMGGIDGIETCRRIKSNASTAEFPVIFLTSSAEDESLLQAFEVGAVDYVVKKMDPAELIARVQTQMQLLDSKRQLLEERDRAEGLNEQMGEFLSIAAHDLKNPLAGIAGFAEILKLQLQDPDPELDEDPIEMLDSMIGSADHMRAIIEDLLVSQALGGEGDKVRSRDVCDLVSIAREVVAVNRHHAQKKGIHLTLEEDGPCPAVVDLIRMREIIDNLVNNAVKYTALETNVTVRLSTTLGESPKVRFEVQDEGAGLTEEDMAKLFGKFQKLSARPTGGETSTGLGLSIVKSYVEMHGGRIWAESEPGKGARFIFEIAKADSENN